MLPFGLGGVPGVLCWFPERFPMYSHRMLIGWLDFNSVHGKSQISPISAKIPIHPGFSCFFAILSAANRSKRFVRSLRFVNNILSNVWNTTLCVKLEKHRKSSAKSIQKRIQIHCTSWFLQCSTGAWKSLMLLLPPSPCAVSTSSSGARSDGNSYSRARPSIKECANRLGRLVSCRNVTVASFNRVAPPAQPY